LLEAQKRFIEDPARHTLTTYLQTQLQQLNQAAGADDAGFDSVFVVDRWGTMLADAYVQDVPTRSVGRNFSWRSYFHGGPEDLPRSRPRELPPVIETSHLSAVFKSATTDKWKIAITTPILDGAPEPTVLGVLSLTINVGDFGVFRNRAQGTDYFAVLVDNRDGERRGTILQHPLFEQQPPAQDYHLTDQQLDGVGQKPGYRYHDPLAEAAGGEKYAGDWIAASAPVDLPRRGKPPLGNGRMDLLVLVQVHADSATAPVRQLGRRLTFDGLMALMLVIAAVLALWVIVFRLPGRPAPARQAIPQGPAPAPWRDLPTITVRKR
jgi:eukaryotic-like serine/threonine-protein kinase